MEDQQPAAGDLTVEDRVDTAEDEAQDEDEAVAAESEDTESDSEDESESEAEAESPAAVEPPVKKVKKKKTGRVAAVLVALAAVLFVGSAAFAGAAVQPYLVERATVDIKQNVARAAANAITTLWSYTPENMDTLANRAGQHLTGDFGAQYRKFVEESVVAPNKQFKVTTSTEVVGVAVETLAPANATVIVYTNTTTTTPLKKNIPSMQYLSYLLTMKREGDRWLVSRMNTITSLDVTAQL